jgi:hypothetical protein
MPKLHFFLIVSLLKIKKDFKSPIILQNMAIFNSDNGRLYKVLR